MMRLIVSWVTADAGRRVFQFLVMAAQSDGARVFPIEVERTHPASPSVIPAQAGTQTRLSESLATGGLESCRGRAVIATPAFSET